MTKGVNREHSGLSMEAEPNILLMRLKSMGDVVFTLPAVHLLRESLPRARITFLVSAENAPLLEGFRDVDETIALNRARFRSGNPLHILAETFTLFRRLRRGRFSLVVDFQGYGETAWLARLSGAPQRWGSVHSTPRHWAYTRSFSCNDQIHPVEWYLWLLHQCGLPTATVRNEFVLPDNALNEARSFFAAHALALDRPTLFVQPFTSTREKNWPLDRYCAVAHHWRGCERQVLFGGGPADRAALEPVHQAGFQVSAGVPLLMSAGLAKLCTLTLAGDTGLLHLATAMAKRVVAIIPSTTPGSKYPFGHLDWAITPATGVDISTIGTETVIAECEGALADPGIGGAPPPSR
jgi:ADP-heptose:LPS heptosyltransferase